MWTKTGLSAEVLDRAAASVSSMGGISLGARQFAVNGAMSGQAADIRRCAHPIAVEVTAKVIAAASAICAVRRCWVSGQGCPARALTSLWPAMLLVGMTGLGFATGGFPFAPVGDDAVMLAELSVVWAAIDTCVVQQR